MASNKKSKKKVKKKVKKKSKKKKNIFFLLFLYLGKTDMVLGKKVAIFDWEWGRIGPLEMGRKSPAFPLVSWVRCGT